MMGKDVERMLKHIDKIKKLLEKAIDDITAEMDSPINLIPLNTEPYVHATTPQQYIVSSDKLVEQSKPFSGSLDKLVNVVDDIEDDCKKMKDMDKKMFVDKSEFNNSIGSPWTEFEKLQEAIKDMDRYYANHSALNYIGQKSAMCSLCNAVLSCAIDAKWSLIIYHDYVQRGFDNLYNNNVPSITFTDGLNNHQTTGNVDQNIDNNVGIKKESIDPY